MSNFLIKNYVIFSPLPAKYREGYAEIYTQKNKNQESKKRKKRRIIFRYYQGRALPGC